MKGEEGTLPHALIIMLYRHIIDMNNYRGIMMEGDHPGITNNDKGKGMNEREHHIVF